MTTIDYCACGHPGKDERHVCPVTYERLEIALASEKEFGIQQRRLVASYAGAVEAKEARVQALEAENSQLRQWYSEVIGSLAPERLSSIPLETKVDDCCPKCDSEICIGLGSEPAGSEPKIEVKS